MEIRSEFVTVDVSDGTSMRLYVARPAGAAPTRGLLVMQEAFGINSHIRDITERFAREGFLAVAPELYHRTGAGFEGKYDDFGAVMPHMKELRDPNQEVDIKAAHDWLRSNGIASGAPLRRSATAWADAPRFSPRSRCRSSARFRIMAAALRRIP